MTSLIESPFVAPGQLDDPLWLLATALVSVYVVFAYAFYWPKGTLSHGRPLHPGFVLLFGILWGGCQGQLVLAIFRLIQSAELATIWTVLIMLLVYSTLTALWHSRFWDIHVSPDHNIYEWNARKVLVAHTPFLILAVTHLALFDNAALFVVWQIMALVTSSYVMRFPAPSDPESPAHDGAGVRQSAE